MATENATTRHPARGSLKPDLLVRELPAIGSLPAFRFAMIPRLPGATLIGGLAREWRLIEARGRVALMEAEDDDARMAAADAVDARLEALEEAMASVMPTSGEDVTALIEIAIAIMERHRGAAGIYYQTIDERIRPLLEAALEGVPDLGSARGPAAPVMADDVTDDETAPQREAQAAGLIGDAASFVAAVNSIPGLVALHRLGKAVEAAAEAAYLPLVGRATNKCAASLSVFAESLTAASLAKLTGLAGTFAGAMTSDDLAAVAPVLFSEGLQRAAQGDGEPLELAKVLAGRYAVMAGPAEGETSNA